MQGGRKEVEMNKQFINGVIQKAIYTKKSTTKDGYYWSSGSTILPNRLSISRGRNISFATKAGRNLQYSQGQLIGRFTKKEQSVLKQNKPFELRTQVWSITGYPEFIGYGTVGISDESGKITRESDKGDLVILYSTDNWETIQIFYLPRMVDNLEAVMEYLITII